MLRLSKDKYYIVIKSFYELKIAKANIYCRTIIYEKSNVIYIWNRNGNKWIENVYVAFDDFKEQDYLTSGHIAYLEFYEYVGKEELDKMKNYYAPLNIIDSYEQMHYANIEYAHTKIYKNIYVYDCNSSFTYGALCLPDIFYKLKEYLIMLYNKKKNAKTQLERSRFKNLQNYLIGYFARIKQLVAVRSNIIARSNSNIKHKMTKIYNAGGVVYLSNTDSIVTDDIGNKIMQEYAGLEVGQFKLENTSDRLYYNSPNDYQIGNKSKHSGVAYFANKHTDYFEDKFAEQAGSLIEDKEYILSSSDDDLQKVCRVELGQITVTVRNFVGDIIETIIYKIKE